MKGQLFSFGDGDPRRLDSPKDWGTKRTIRGYVLAELLVQAGASGPPAIRQIQIQGTRVTGAVDLSHAEVVTAVRFERCFFEAALKLPFARTRNFEFGGCVLASVDATGASIEGFLAITQSRVCVALRLAGAGVSHAVVLSGSMIAGGDGRAVTADSLEVGGSLFLRDGFHAAGEVRLLGARISGQLICSGGCFHNPGGIALDASGTDIRGDAVLQDGFHATGETLLLGARIAGQLNCSDGRFGNPNGTALAADGAVIHRDAFLSYGFCATGEVRLPDARIAGRLVCSGGRFDNPAGIALAADGADITGDAQLDAGFHATGEVRLLGARIAGELDCSGGRFDNPRGIGLSADGQGPDPRGPLEELEGFALRADGAVIRGGVDMHGGFHATGMVRLVDTRIGMGLNCAGGRFDNPNGCALTTDRAEIGGGVFLGKLPGSANGFRAKGEVRLLDTRIRGQLRCTDGRFENPKGIALGADRANITGDARLDADFHAAGEVRLLGARIHGQLRCVGGQFKNPRGRALTLQDAQANSLLLRGRGLQIAGDIHLFGAKISTLADEPAALADQDVTLYLDGFVYERIAPSSSQEVRTRLQWLKRQPPGYYPQPFDQLAAVYRRNGQDHEARDVLIEKRRARRATLRRWWRKCGDRFLDSSVRYGWQAWRPLLFGFGVLLLVSGLVSRADATSLVVSLSDVVSPYNSFIHALDVFLPIVDLGVESRWTIDAANGGAFAWLVMAFLWTLKLVGWGTVTLAVAALTGIVKRE